MDEFSWTLRIRSLSSSQPSFSFPFPHRIWFWFGSCVPGRREVPGRNGMGRPFYFLTDSESPRVGPCPSTPYGPSDRLDDQ